MAALERVPQLLTASVTCIVCFCVCTSVIRSCVRGYAKSSVRACKCACCACVTSTLHAPVTDGQLVIVPVPAFAFVFAVVPDPLPSKPIFNYFLNLSFLLTCFADMAQVPPAKILTRAGCIC